MPVEAVVLSRTRMWGDKFCSTVAVRNGQRWRQVRPLLEGGDHLTTHSFRRYDAQTVDQDWRPGRIVTFDRFTPSYLRPTHPEDHIIDPDLVQMGEEVSDQDLRAIMAQFTCRQLRLLYPGYNTQGNNKVYMLGNLPLNQSVGYVRCQQVIFHDDGYADIVVDQRLVRCRVKGDGLLTQIDNGQVPIGTPVRQPLVRFALATPWDRDGTFHIPRCYIMLSGIW